MEHDVIVTSLDAPTLADGVRAVRARLWAAVAEAARGPSDVVVDCADVLVLSAEAADAVLEAALRLGAIARGLVLRSVTPTIVDLVLATASRSEYHSLQLEQMARDAWAIRPADDRLAN